MTSSWRWATVTQAAPLRVRLDGASSALPVTPDTLVAGLVVGDRVWCQLDGRALVIHGAAPTGWQSAPLAPGFTGDVQYRRAGPLVEVKFAAFGTVPGMAITYVTDGSVIRADYRPAGTNARGEAWIGGAGRPAGLFVTTDGRTGVINHSTTPGASAEGRVIYTTG